jgi:phosphate transport system permease protein
MKGSPGKKSGYGDKILSGLAFLAALIALVTLFAIVFQVTKGAKLSFETFGLGFITDPEWNPNAGDGGIYGAWVMLYGTLVSSFVALIIAVPVGVAIGLYLSELAPPSVARIVGPLVEMLAAVPSVIVGFWGLIVLAPFLSKTVEPKLHDTLGFIPLFGEPQTTGNSLFAACIVLSIMILPIVASVSRDLFLTVPRDVKDGAEALGATHWEVVRGIDLPSCTAGIASASLLALGRALGEAIAVTQVVGGGQRVISNLFAPGDTLAGRLAAQCPSALTDLHRSSMMYLGVLLLIIGVTANLFAVWIVRRFDYQRRAV